MGKLWIFIDWGGTPRVTCFGVNFIQINVSLAFEVNFEIWCETLCPNLCGRNWDSPGVSPVSRNGPHVSLPGGRGGFFVFWVVYPYTRFNLGGKVSHIFLTLSVVIKRRLTDYQRQIGFPLPDFTA